MDLSCDLALEEIVQTIYETMLGIELAPAGPSAESDHESLLAAVQIAGQWMGSVVLALSPAAARESASAMLQISADELTAADLQDVAAELANMIGGNLKSLLPGPSVLSLPTIVECRESELRMHNADLIDTVSLAAPAGGMLRVRVYANLASRQRRSTGASTMS
jgi:chemotaxis protein CheX